MTDAETDREQTDYERRGVLTSRCCGAPAVVRPVFMAEKDGTKAYQVGKAWICTGTVRRGKRQEFCERPVQNGGGSMVGFRNLPSDWSQELWDLMKTHGPRCRSAGHGFYAFRDTDGHLQPLHGPRLGEAGENRAEDGFAPEESAPEAPAEIVEPSIDIPFEPSEAPNA